MSAAPEIMRCRRPLMLTSFVAVAVLSLLVAGCGGGSSPGVASISSSTSTSSSSSGSPPTQAQLQQEQHDATRFAQCMRSHGVSIPDPTVAPRAFKNAFSTPTSAFRSALTTCGHLLPAGHAPNQTTAPTRAQTDALLAFARCLRGHGFPSFPDPTSRGELTHEMLARAGIDLHEPATVQAADACTSVTHGVITRAVVAHFIAGR
jgi:hypothetical protein